MEGGMEGGTDLAHLWRSTDTYLPALYVSVLDSTSKNTCVGKNELSK